MKKTIKVKKVLGDELGVVVDGNVVSAGNVLNGHFAHSNRDQVKKGGLATVICSCLILRVNHTPTNFSKKVKFLNELP